MMSIRVDIADIAGQKKTGLNRKEPPQTEGFTEGQDKIKKHYFELRIMLSYSSEVHTLDCLRRDQCILNFFSLFKIYLIYIFKIFS